LKSASNPFRDCQIFLGPNLPKRWKYAKWPQTAPTRHKVCIPKWPQIAYTKWPKIVYVYQVAIICI
jgi:hypothetical protein